MTSANVQSPPGERKQRLAERFRQRRVRLDQCGRLLGGRLPVDREVPGTELLGDPGARHVHAENLPGGPVGSLLGDDLHYTVGVADDLRSTVATEGVLLHDDLVALLLGGRFGQSAERDLGVRIDRPRHAVVVDGHHGLTEDRLDRHYGFGKTNVGQLGGVRDHVADREDVRVGGALVTVSDNEAAVVDLDVVTLAEQCLGSRATADGEDDHLDLHVVATIDEDRGGTLLGRVPGHGDAGAYVNAALLERALHHGDDVGITTGQDRGQGLEDGDLRAHVGEH